MEPEPAPDKEATQDAPRGRRPRPRPSPGKPPGIPHSVRRSTWDADAAEMDPSSSFFVEGSARGPAPGPGGGAKKRTRKSRLFGFLKKIFRARPKKQQRGPGDSARAQSPQTRVDFSKDEIFSNA